MDLKQQDKRSYYENKIFISSSSSNPSSLIKTCSVCNTSRTPLWRGGPAGPKSLCNACGIKYNKKRREMLGLNRGKKNDKTKKKKKKNNNNNNNGGASKNPNNNKKSEVTQTMKMRLMGLGHDHILLLHRSDKLMNKLREEEQAAILLMALSYGSIYA